MSDETKKNPTQEIAKGGLPPALKEKMEEKKEGDEKKDDAAEKAMLSEDDLQKSLTALEAIAKSSPTSRRDELFEKSRAGAISTEENAELIRILSGQTGDKTLSQSVSKSMENDTLQKSIDVSPYLDELHTDLAAALGQVAEHIEKSDARDQEQIVVLAKAMHDIGTAQIETMRLVKGLGERLGVISRQPVRAPKAQLGQGQVLEKGFAGQPPAGEELSKPQVLNYLTEMNMASGDGLSKSGEPLVDAITKFEQFNQISPPLLNEVKDFHRYRRTNGHAAR